VQLEWQGFYLDGKSALRKQATVRLASHGLQLILESGRTLFWPYQEIHQTQGFYSGEQVRLEKEGEVPEALLISDAAFLTSLRRLAPEQAGHFHNPAGRKRRIPLVVAAALAVTGIVAGLYFWGIPTLAEIGASYVPVSWEERMGQTVVAHLAPEQNRCTDPTRTKVLQEILAKLVSPISTPAYTVRVIVTNDPAVNALAAPGGLIVVFQGLLDQTQTAEELAGVLAHELQHVFGRHATRMLLQHASAGLLMAALTGDASGAVTYGLETARVFASFHYSRKIEEEADRAGMEMLLRAGIDPSGMIGFFENLKQRGGDLPGFLNYLSTHPTAEDRIASLRAQASQSTKRSTKLLQGYDWKDARKICKTHAPRAKRIARNSSPLLPSYSMGR
jgi:predicted Zn-dependent protease